VASEYPKHRNCQVIAKLSSVCKMQQNKLCLVIDFIDVCEQKIRYTVEINSHDNGL